MAAVSTTMIRAFRRRRLPFTGMGARRHRSGKSGSGNGTGGNGNGGNPAKREDTRRKAPAYWDSGGKKKGQPLMRGGGSYDPKAMQGSRLRDTESGTLRPWPAGERGNSTAKLQREASVMVGQEMSPRASPAEVLETLSMMVEHDPRAASRLASLLAGLPKPGASAGGASAATDHLAAAIRLDAEAGGTPATAAAAAAGADPAAAGALANREGKERMSARELSAGLQVPAPTARQLKLVAVEAMVPFIGFGFIDNALMILAGDYIDLTLGVTFGVSTMFAAGLGNLISDVAGVGLGGVVERFAEKMGLPTAQLTRAQLKLRITRYTHHGGCALGVAIGCLLGMFPLYFMDTDKAERLKHEKKHEHIVHDAE